MKIAEARLGHVHSVGDVSCVISVTLKTAAEVDEVMHIFKADAIELHVLALCFFCFPLLLRHCFVRKRAQARSFSFPTITPATLVDR